MSADRILRSWSVNGRFRARRQPIMQCIRSNIRAIGPHGHTQLVQTHLGKNGGVAQWLEHGTFQSIGHVPFPLAPVIEFNVQNVWANDS